MSSPSAPPSNARKWLVGCVVVAGILGLLGAASLVGLAFWSQGRSDAADAAGRAYCAQVQPGDTVESVTARAAADPAHPNVTNWDDQLVMVTYAGGWMHAATCKVVIADGKVAGAELQIADD